MWTSEASNVEIVAFIDNYLTSSETITTHSKEFNEYFELTKDNLICKKDSIFIIPKDYIDSYDDYGTFISGIPLFTIISWDDIEDKDSKKVRLDIKIPYKLNILYNSVIDDINKYVVYIVENGSKLFQTNIIEENVDNSYITIKELLDGKFNLIRQLNYEKVPFALSEILSNNAIKGFSMLIYEIMTMGLSRELGNASKEFRHTAKGNDKFNTFQMINVRDISRNTSAFSALASENISKSLLTILSSSKADDKNATITPQEVIALSKF